MKKIQQSFLFVWRNNSQFVEMNKTKYWRCKAIKKQKSQSLFLMQKIKERGGKVEFDYFYNRDGDRFSYYMLAKIIVTDERFKNLSSDAKILYSCLLERTSLSFRNKWLDEENRVYIIFTVEEIMEILGRSNETTARILNELDSTSGSGNF